MLSTGTPQEVPAGRACVCRRSRPRLPLARGRLSSQVQSMADESAAPVDAVDWAAGLPLECYLHIFSFAPLASLGRCAAVSRDWRLVTDDDELWQKLLRTVWCTLPVRGPHGAARDTFLKKLDSYGRLYHRRMSEESGWLLTEEVTEDDEHTQSTRSWQELAWTGNASQTRGNTVGLGLLHALPEPWPCNATCDWRVHYFETTVKDAGAHGFVAAL